MFKKFAANHVIVIPGDDFMVDNFKWLGESGEDNKKKSSGPVFRLSFAAAQPDNIETGIQRLASTVQEIRRELLR